jgi:hypothetical protein
LKSLGNNEIKWLAQPTARKSTARMFPEIEVQKSPEAHIALCKNTWTSRLTFSKRREDASLHSVALRLSGSKYFSQR